MSDLQIEVNGKAVKESQPLATVGILITPASVGKDDYWLMRVKVGPNQSVVCFPKFCLIGCGFAKEEDWNTNLPLSCDAVEIFQHIKHNKGDNSIPDERCVQAIKMLQDAAKQAKLI